MRAEIADRPPMIIGPRERHNEQYGAQDAREWLPEEADAYLPHPSRAGRAPTRGHLARCAPRVADYADHWRVLRQPDNVRIA